MKNFTSKFWEWLFNRSPQNAAKPNIQTNPTEGVGSMSMPADTEPLETYLETESILGGPIKIGSEEGALSGPNGQLIRAHNALSIPTGCGHIVSQFQAVDKEDQHVRGIAGICFYCQQELQELLQKGECTAFDTQRLALICSDCGKITESGELCCPKHYKAITAPNGTTTYLGPEDTKQLERQDITKKILGSIVLLFADDSQQTPRQTIQEQSNGQTSL